MSTKAGRANIPAIKIEDEALKTPIEGNKPITINSKDAIASGRTVCFLIKLWIMAPIAKTSANTSTCQNAVCSSKKKAHSLNQDKSQYRDHPSVRHSLILLYAS
jgi:hypothetical protein